MRRLGANGDPITTTYTLDKLNRVTSAITGADTVSYAYDLNGNQTSKTANGSTQNRVYDRENRLISVNDGGGTTLFSAVYDYRTRRLEKTEDGGTVKFVYDSGDCVQEYNAGGSLTKQLVRGTSLGGGIGGVLYSESASSAKEFFIYNAIGSVVALSDMSGVATATTDYEAFGNVVASTGSTQENRLFCTKERSASIGLDNFGFRYYDAELGRFIQRDPAGYPDGANNYIYCSNNPVNFIDPLGLKKRSEYQEDIEAIEELRSIHHEAWKKQNNYEDATEKERSRLDKKWANESARYDKAVDKIKGYIQRLDKKREKYNQEASKVFGASEISEDWDDEKIVNWKFGVRDEGPLGGERIDRFLAREIGYGIATFYATAGAGNLLKATRFPRLLATIGAHIKNSLPFVKKGVQFSDDAVNMITNSGDDALLGVIDKAGNIKLFKAGPNVTINNTQILGHADLVKAGLVGEGSQGFSLVVKNGEIVHTMTQSTLNSAKNGYQLAKETATQLTKEISKVAK